MTTYRSAGTGTPIEFALLEYSSLTETINGFYEFLESTGLKANRVFSSYAVTTPVPLYDQDRPARWMGVDPAMMWHPLFWLPERLAQRIEFNGMTEPALPWAMRVCLELSAAGLYLPGQGWLDVLVDSGIDATTPAGQARIYAWQTGSSDPVLDQVNLNALLTNQGGDPDWAASAVDGIFTPVLGTANHLAASEVLEAFQEALGTTSAPLFFGAAENAASLAMVSVAQIEDEDAYLVDQVPEEFWTNVSEQLSSFDSLDDAEGAKAGPVAAAITWLEQVRDFYHPQLNVLLGEDEYDEPSAPETQPRRAIG